MDLEITTPTHVFERSDFHCSENNSITSKKPLSSEHDSNIKDSPKRSVFRLRSSTWAGQGRGRKRKASDRGNDFKYRKRLHRHRQNFVLPNKFLLGGNINDPLNLNSMCDEEVNRALNEKTPESSPLPSLRHTVQLLIPVNIHDPLNLNGTGDGYPLVKSLKRKRGKTRYKRKSGSDGDLLEDDNSISLPDKKIVDEIVSPAIPQDLPKKRRKRTSSEGVKSDHEDDKNLPQKVQKVKFYRQSSGSLNLNFYQKSHQKISLPKKQKKYEFGNAPQYCGCLHPDKLDDKRMSYFKREWFEGRDVLDIGCNVGHISLCVARDFLPRQIIGLDIDSDLIDMARKNIRNFLTNDMSSSNKFPDCMINMYGPLFGPPVTTKWNNAKRTFQSSLLENISFLQGDYVLSNDEMLATETEQFDVILVLSVTKWVHLNHGDHGLKRFFKRIYKQLRPGGRLILEPQSWASYKRKKTLTSRIFDNYSSITFRPEHFNEYLLSREVGFCKCEVISKYNDRAPKGYQRLVHMFMKPTTTYPTPYPTPLNESQLNTPVQHIYTQAPPIEATYVSTSNNTPSFTPNLSNEKMLEEHILQQQIHAQVHKHLLEMEEQQEDSNKTCLKKATDSILEYPSRSPLHSILENVVEKSPSVNLENDGRNRTIDNKSNFVKNRHQSGSAEEFASILDNPINGDKIQRTSSAPALLQSTDEINPEQLTNMSSSSSSSSSSFCSRSNCSDCCSSCSSSCNSNTCYREELITDNQYKGQESLTDDCHGFMYDCPKKIQCSVESSPITFSVRQDDSIHLSLVPFSSREDLDKSLTGESPQSDDDNQKSGSELRQPLLSTSDPNQESKPIDEECAVQEELKNDSVEVVKKLTFSNLDDCSKDSNEDN